MTKNVPFREIVEFARGGGWGSDIPQDDYEPVAVIRGTDFAAVMKGEMSAVPRRWEKSSKLPQRILRAGDVVLEISGGSSAKGQTTGRSIFIEDVTLAAFEVNVIPASFCRVVRFDGCRVIPTYAYYALQDMYLSGRAGLYEYQSTGISNFQFERFLDAELLRLPSIDEQGRVAATLKAIDDKIAVNNRIATTARVLGQAKFAGALEGPGFREIEVSELVTVLTRGVAPKYSEDADALTVLNQKCIRNGRVTLSPARKTLREKVRGPKFLRRSDVLVNSTGVGTLGRVARWTLDLEATVDSHVTIMRFDPEKVDPVCAGFAMLSAQPDIEALGEGSTGQTELSRLQLGAYRIALPSDEAMGRLRPELDSLEARVDAALVESITLAELRDTLLPKLMSGEIRVRDAEKLVKDAA